jgi:hypothetical protein
MMVGLDGWHESRRQLCVFLITVGVAAAIALGEAGAAMATGATPRFVDPSKLAPTTPVNSSGDIGEEPPLGGGEATSGLPNMMGDKARGEGEPNIAGRSLFQIHPFFSTGNYAQLLGFTGATFGNTCTEKPEGCFGSEPPDTQMAAGKNEIIEAVNNNILVYSKGGKLLANFPVTNVFQPPKQEVGVTDPKIVFDPTTGDYYMTEMVCEKEGCGGSTYPGMGISLAITSEPLGSWTVYDYLNKGENLQDQEKLGFSGDKITFAVNEYGCKCGAGSKFKQENVVVVQKSDAVAGNTIFPSEFSANSFSSYIFDSMPTTPVNASTSDNTQYVVWDKQASSGNELALIRITGTPNEKNVNFTGSVTKIGLANQSGPPAPVEPGGKTVAGDKQNFQSAMVQGNDLWAVATDGCTPNYPKPDTETRDCTRLVEVNLAKNSVTTDTDLGTDGTYRYNPSVMKDGSGHLYFGFTLSSASQFPTASLDASALPLPAVLTRTDMASGNAAYTAGRWGDYSGTKQDPTDTNDVWTAQEFGACSTGGCNFTTFGGEWQTELGQFTFAEPRITKISPTEGPVTGGTKVDIYGSDFAKEATTVKFGENAASSITWIDSEHIQAVSPPGEAGTVDVIAATGAGTSEPSSADMFTYIKLSTEIIYTGPHSADYNDSVMLAARLINQATSEGVEGETLTFELGSASCSETTNSSGEARCAVTLHEPSAGLVKVKFAGGGPYLSSEASVAFSVTPEETAIEYTGPTVFLKGSPATLKGKLLEDGSADNDKDGGSAAPGPVQNVILSLGAQDCLGTTNSSGEVECTIASVTVASGPEPAIAFFPGTEYYAESEAAVAATVFTPLNPGLTECNGYYGGSGQEVVVPTGATCVLAPGTKVAKNVHVMTGGTLVDEGAAIGGDLNANNPKAVTVAGGSVGGNLQIQGLTGSPPGGKDNFVCGASIGHDMTVQNAAATAGPIVIGGSPDCGAGNKVGHDLSVQNNATAVTVSNNTVAHNVNIQGNTHGVLVEHNQAGEELQVQNNSGGVTVTNNHAGHNAQCQNNKPTTAGSGNTAGSQNKGCP